MGHRHEVIAGSRRRVTYYTVDVGAAAGGGLSEGGGSPVGLGRPY